MPGPSSFTPRPVKPSLPKRHFTLAMANKTLPLVKRVVADIVAAHDHALDLQAKAERLRDGATEQQTIQKDLDGTLDRLQTFVDELTEIGCELKDYQTGLIDFVGRHQGREIYLCWKLGEDKIAYWHELSAGVAGRKPVATLDER
jgi:hypothetical protein